MARVAALPVDQVARARRLRDRLRLLPLRRPPGLRSPAGQCADSSLAVKATADKATFAPGEEPSFTIVITNIGSATCDRDLAGGLQQVLVYSIDGKTRLWSNVDCYPQPAADVRNLAPGEQAAFKGRLVGHDVDPRVRDRAEPRAQSGGRRRLHGCRAARCTAKLPGAVQHRMSAGKPEQAR